MNNFAQKYKWWIVGGVAALLVLIAVPMLWGNLLISLLTERPVLSENNLVMDPYVTLDEGKWDVSIPGYHYGTDEKGIPELNTPPSGMEISQRFQLDSSVFPKQYILRGQFGSERPQDSFYVTLDIGNGEKIFSKVVDPTDTFSFEIPVPATQQGAADKGELHFELAPGAHYLNPWVELTAK